MSVYNYYVNEINSKTKIVSTLRDFEQRPATAINGTKTTETKTRSKSAAKDMIIDVCTIGPGDIIGKQDFEEKINYCSLTRI